MKRKDQRKIKISDFYCTSCGTKGISIPRIKGKERESGHLKRLYCFNCQKETEHIEIRESSSYTLQDFQLEYYYHNFDDNGQRILTINQVRSKAKEEGVDLNGY